MDRFPQPAAPWDELGEAMELEGKLGAVGLDPILSYINTYPEFAAIDDITEKTIEFNRQLIEATAARAKCYKINPIFYQYEKYPALIETVATIRRYDPSITIIYDGKTGDVPHSNQEMADFLFDRLGVDAV